MFIYVRSFDVCFVHVMLGCFRLSVRSGKFSLHQVNSSLVRLVSVRTVYFRFGKARSAYFSLIQVMTVCFSLVQVKSG
jgi:hypothetical protein